MSARPGAEGIPWPRRLGGAVAEAVGRLCNIWDLAGAQNRMLLVSRVASIGLVRIVEVM